MIIENVEGVQRLVINSVETKNEGSYSCVAENEAGSTKTDAKLVVESESCPPRSPRKHAQAPHERQKNSDTSAVQCPHCSHLKTQKASGRCFPFPPRPGTTHIFFFSFFFPLVHKPNSPEIWPPAHPRIFFIFFRSCPVPRRRG